MVMSGWRDLAACRDEDPELFFPVHESKPDEPATAGELQALAVCAGCPVRAACREWALNTGHVQFGVVGGLTAGQRRVLWTADRNQKRIPA
ncbi:MAG: WhiB family transcriptional regulator [Gammaproteobacteria bacterium]